ncbi:MAG: hypothetical protein QXU95_01085 [Candidatus Bathyarchaeia archaeon]
MKSLFWNKVRGLIYEKAVELYIQDRMHLNVFIMPTDSELRDYGYFERAKRSAFIQINSENIWKKRLYSEKEMFKRSFHDTISSSHSI